MAPSGYVIVPTFHPAFLLRNPGPDFRRQACDDLKLIRREYDRVRGQPRTQRLSRTSCSRTSSPTSLIAGPSRIASRPDWRSGVARGSASASRSAAGPVRGSWSRSSPARARGQGTLRAAGDRPRSRAGLDPGAARADTLGGGRDGERVGGGRVPGAPAGHAIGRAARAGAVAACVSLRPGGARHRPGPRRPRRAADRGDARDRRQRPGSRSRDRAGAGLGRSARDAPRRAGAARRRAPPPLASAGRRGGHAARGRPGWRSGRGRRRGSRWRR